VLSALVEPVLLPPVGTVLTRHISLCVLSALLYLARVASRQTLTKVTNPETVTRPATCCCSNQLATFALLQLETWEHRAVAGIVDVPTSQLRNVAVTAPQQRNNNPATDDRRPTTPDDNCHSNRQSRPNQPKQTSQQPTVGEVHSFTHSCNKHSPTQTNIVQAGVIITSLNRAVLWNALRSCECDVACTTHVTDVLQWNFGCQFSPVLISCGVVALSDLSNVGERRQ